MPTHAVDSCVGILISVLLVATPTAAAQQSAMTNDFEPQLVADISPGASGSFASSFVEAGGRVYFQACHDETWTIYVVDGPGSVPSPLPITQRYDCDEFGQEPQFELVTAGQELVFTVSDQVGADDGENTILYTLPPRVIPGTLASTGDLATFFTRTFTEESDETIVWRTDGTEFTDLGTVPITNLPGEPFGPIWALPGEIFFSIGFSDCCDGLWRTDLTPEGTHRVQPDYEYSTLAPQFAHANGRLFYFDRSPGTSSFDLWVSDGSPDSAVTLGLTDREDIDLRPTDLAALGDHVYFLAYDPLEGQAALWQSDGTPAGTIEIRGFPQTAGQGNFFLRRMVLAADDLLYFTLAVDSRLELWRSDGTAAGTQRAAILPGTSSSLEDLTVVFGQAFFTYDDGVHGVELWRSDGTANGTDLVADLFPGPTNSFPQHMTGIGDRLYFTADSSIGREPWVLSGVPACTTSSRELCLNGRFRVDVTWTDFAGQAGEGSVTELRTDDTGAFWFFEPDNLELLVKVLDGRQLNGHFWVFFGSLSNVAFTLRVTDALTGDVRKYVNESGSFASVGDTTAFASNNGPDDASRFPSEPSHVRHVPWLLGACDNDAEALCLQDGQYRVEVDWTDFAGTTGRGRAVPTTDDTGAFWFFGPENLELLVKVLDGRSINGKIWVFFGSTSNVGFTITVTDTSSGEQQRYENAEGTFASRGDTAAFDGE